MRILLLSVDFTPHRDGVSTLSYHFARRLSERGHEVVVVGPRADGARDEDREAPFTVYRFPGYAWGVARFFPFALVSLVACIRHRPSLVFPMNIGYGGVLCRALRLFGTRYVTMAYAYEFLKAGRRPLLKALYQSIYRRSEKVFSISEYTTGRLVDFGVPREHIAIVPPGVEVAEAIVARPEEGRTTGDGRAHVLGTCGRLIHRKGHDTVIRALPTILRAIPDAEYRVAGDGPARPALERLAFELGVDDHVTFLGRIPLSVLPTFYSGLNLFVMASREDRDTGHVEGFGIVYLEAAMAGVTSVGTRTGGVPEAILDGETGRLVAADDPEALADAVVSLLRDDATRNRMARYAEQRARTQFSWNMQVDKVQAWIESWSARGNRS